MANETNDGGSDDFDPTEMSEDVAEEAKEDRGEPLGRPGDYDDDPGDPMDDEAPATPAPKAPARTYKVKANGREIDVNATSVDTIAKATGVAPQDLLRGTQMFKAGQERLREAAAKEKEAHLIKRALIEGSTGSLSRETRRALKDAGIREEDLHNFSIKQVNELMEIDRLQRENPAELERRKTAAELEIIKGEKEQTEAEVHQARAEEKLGQEIKSVLDANKLPKDPYFVKRLASHMLDHLERGGDADDLNVADFVPLVLDEVALEHTSFLSRLSGEELISRYPGMAEKVRKAYASKVRRDGPPARQPEEREPAEKRAAPPQGRQRMSANEVLRRFRQGG